MESMEQRITEALRKKAAGETLTTADKSALKRRNRKPATSSLQAEADERARLRRNHDKREKYYYGGGAKR
jgi:hypothetical protein